MRKLAIGLVMVGLVGTVAATSAQAQAGATSRANFGFGGGVTFPVGDFHTGFKTGWNAQAMFGFVLPSLPIELRVDGQYNQNSIKPGLGTGKAKTFGALGNAVYHFGAPAMPFRPYVIGGLGFYNVKFSGSAGSASETKFALGGGLGANFGVGTLHAFAEARYISAFTSGSHTNFIPITVGLRFGGGL
ncbi:MAG: outer membrane beta-barrel protein [Gemmatimonadota bacterium]